METKTITQPNQEVWWKKCVDWDTLSFVIDKKRNPKLWFPQLLHSWFIFHRSEIYFSRLDRQTTSDIWKWGTFNKYLKNRKLEFSFLVCKYLSKVPHFQISEVVSLCCIYKTLPPTICWLRTIEKTFQTCNSFSTLTMCPKMFNLFKPLIQHKSAANRHQSWVKITIFVFFTADYIVLRIKIVIGNVNHMSADKMEFCSWQEKIQSLDSANCLILGLF